MEVPLLNSAADWEILAIGPRRDSPWMKVAAKP